jgi:hypothetical protein
VFHVNDDPVQPGPCHHLHGLNGWNSGYCAQCATPFPPESAQPIYLAASASVLLLHPGFHGLTAELQYRKTFHLLQQLAKLLRWSLVIYVIDPFLPVTNVGFTETEFGYRRLPYETQGHGIRKQR